MEPVLLTRYEFRKQVFARDKQKCVYCELPGVDAHHIMERRLFPDGGYYVDNGVTLCGDCHEKAEATTISCETLRERAGITRIILPPHFETEGIWDKWGNPILSSGLRLRGELFDEEPVQKILRPILHQFTTRVKYPRTFHLPWSPNLQNDDRMMGLDIALAAFTGKEVVITEKMDGENTTMYRDYIHARSLDSKYHESRSTVRAIHGTVSYELPEGWRLCGENMYAKHSIYYENLDGYFLVFSVWNDKNICLSWDETETWAALLNLPTVPVLWRGVLDNLEAKVMEVAETIDPLKQEGFVIRLANSFHMRQFPYAAAKYVRAKHVQTDEHWMRSEIVPNKLKAELCSKA